MIKYIGNIDNIKKEVKKAKLPKEFVLSDCAKITNVKQFIDSHLIILDVPKLVFRHRPYYERLKQVLDTLDIQIEIIEKK